MRELKCGRRSGKGAAKREREKEVKGERCEREKGKERREKGKGG